MPSVVASGLALIGDAGLEASLRERLHSDAGLKTSATHTIATVSVANAFWSSDPCPVRRVSG